MGLKNMDQTLIRPYCPKSIYRRFDFPRMMTIIIDNQSFPVFKLALTQNLKPSSHAFKLKQPIYNVLVAYPQFRSNCDGRQSIKHIMATRPFELNRQGSMR